MIDLTRVYHRYFWADNPNKRDFREYSPRRPNIRAKSKRRRLSYYNLDDILLTIQYVSANAK